MARFVCLSVRECHHGGRSQSGAPGLRSHHLVPAAHVRESAHPGMSRRRPLPRRRPAGSPCPPCPGSGAVPSPRRSCGGDSAWRPAGPASAPAGPLPVWANCHPRFRPKGSLARRPGSQHRPVPLGIDVHARATRAGCDTLSGSQSGMTREPTFYDFFFAFPVSFHLFILQLSLLLFCSEI